MAGFEKMENPDWEYEELRSCILGQCQRFGEGIAIIMRRGMAEWLLTKQDRTFLESPDDMQIGQDVCIPSVTNIQDNVWNLTAAVFADAILIMT